MTPSPSSILAAPLTPGLIVLEASAGTGKTYALAALATRWVAERGVKASELCIVSFTEAATAELRGRVRTHLAEAAAHVTAGCPPTDDEVLRALADAPAEVRADRLANLERALADFDAATISTIHGFCARLVAAGGGAAGDLPLSDDNTDVRERVNDLYLARFGGGEPWAAAPERVIQAVELRLKLPDATMWIPDRATVPVSQVERADTVGLTAHLVDELVAHVTTRRVEQRRRTFDSLISDARTLLVGPAGPATVAALRDRFRLVLIDEFQDTDQVQWDIFRRVFLVGNPAPAGPGPSTGGGRPDAVVLVGDPKQSIYRFRSAELSAYLEACDYARAHGGRIVSLATNWRSDAPLIEALGQLFAGCTFGDERVEFERVEAAPGHERGALAGVDEVALQIRCLPDDLKVPEVRAIAVPDLVAEVVRLLNAASLPGADPPRPLRASDIGVLVRSNADANTIAAALGAAGVPAARSASDSVLDSPAAAQWRTLLTALERPASASRTRAAALTWFVGLSAAELAALDDDGLAELIERQRAWAACLDDGGLPRLMAALREGGLLRHVLSHPGGERDLTDLDHLVELLQGATGGRPTSAGALLGTLDDLAGDDGAGVEGVASDLLARRIDRDDDTVKVITVHKAKGLEFPVVLCPILWGQRANLRGLPHGYVDGGRQIDTDAMLAKSTTAGAFQLIKEADRAERLGEDRRLLYVALTRAKHRLVVWWSGAAHGKGSGAPLGDLLGHAVGGDGAPVDVDALVSASVGRIGRVVVPVDVVPEVLAPTGEPPPTLEVAQATRRLDDTWAIWSFTRMKSAAEARGAVSVGAARTGAAVESGLGEAPVIGGSDEPSLDEAANRPGEGAAEIGPGGARALPLQSAPGGTGFGTLVHSVLERVDFTAADLPAELQEACADALRYRRLPITPDVLADGLLPALHAPLGGPVGALRLADIHRADRLDELGFDLHLAAFGAQAIADVLVTHLPADDRLRPWAERAASGTLDVDIDGMLTGSIDLVARSGPDGPYWLADYKTNFLASPGEYAVDGLARAMDHHAYPLQATLYLVALHRYLRWRRPGYDPDRDLIGAAYLFLRGMDPDRAANDTHGVFWWRPPTVVLDQLDHLLASGDPT